MTVTPSESSGVDEVFNELEKPTPAPSKPKYPFLLVSRGTGDLKTRYRPQKLSELAPTCSIEQLKKLIGNQNSSQVFLFEGNTGSGKTTCARMIAKANVCLSEGEKPCLACKHCQGFDQNWDVTEINIADQRKIENVRDLIQEMAYLPQFLGKKIYILDEVQQLTPEAQQVLLKLLEEPPSYLWVFLCTTNKKDLNKALVDRASTINFRPLSALDAGYIIDQVIANEKREPVPLELKTSFYDNCHGSVRALLNNIQSYLEGGYDPNFREEEELTGDTRSLALALLDKNWTKVAACLKSPIFRTQTEAQRIAVESYLRGMLLRSPDSLERVGPIFESLHGTLITEPMPYNGLVLKCLRACL